MNKKIRLVTVTGSRTDTLWHMLNHYKDLVDEMYVVVYEWEGSSTYNEVLKITKQFEKAKIVERVTKEKFNWEYVTQMYNETKMLFPNDWWIVSDDDEFHIYSKPLNEIISACERNGWELVRGGFIDRIGQTGDFPKINKKENIFDQFPVAGFFRYPMSGACPNKICIMKGYIEITPGQHYAKLNGQTTWRWQGWNHPLISKHDSVQVHHFKWDRTAIDRIKDVASIKQQYAYSDEYQLMYDKLRKCRFKIDLTNPEFMFSLDLTEPKFNQYRQWNKLYNKIKSI
jgi:hypothetical protein